MDVIGIIGSPRKGGNTDVLVQNILVGAKSAGAEVRSYYLQDLTMKGCQSCFFVKPRRIVRSKMMQPQYCKI